MTIFETEVLEVIRRASDVISFRFRNKDNVGFTAGQYFLVMLTVNSTEQTKPFSFSNSPTETGYIEFTKRITGSDFSKALSLLQPGDKVKLKMPSGTFTLKEEGEKIAYLVGGIGITPVRSMCKFATDKKLSTDIVLLYANRDPDSIVFKDDLDTMQAVNRNLRVVYIVSSADVEKTGPACRLGHIDDAMIKAEVPDYSQRIFYSCGPPKMVECMIDLLQGKLYIPKEQIRRENFAGY